MHHLPLILSSIFFHDYLHNFSPEMMHCFRVMSIYTDLDTLQAKLCSVHIVNIVNRFLVMLFVLTGLSFNGAML